MRDPILEEARRLHQLGFAILWLKNQSKAPVENGWASGPRKDWEELKKTYRPGMNVGVRLGTPSDLLGAYLAVIDLDVKSGDPRHRKEAVKAVKTVLGGLQCPVVRSGRGNGSRHYYVVTEAPLRGYDAVKSEETVKVLMPSVRPSGRELKALTTKEIEKGLRLRRAWEISILSDGRQAVLPPSIHPDSGRRYLWSRELNGVLDIPVLRQLPARLKDGKDGDGGKTGNTVLEDFEISPVELAWLPISESVRSAIVDGTGVSDRSAYLVKASSALFSAGLTRNEVLTVLTDPDTYLGACGYDHAQSSSRKAAARWVYRYTVEKTERERSPSVFAEVPFVRGKKLNEAEQAAQAQEFAEDRNWRQDLLRTKEGGLRHTLKNLDLILTCGVHENVFVEDTFAARTEYGVDVPWDRKAGEYLDDKDLIRVKRWLADTEFGIEPSKEIIFEATMLIADRRRRHPVREWLDSLKWDGKKRIDTWLRDYCRARAEEPYLSEVSRKFLLAMVTRIFRPGCQWDYILVLEGNQGKRKSSMARALATDRWFMDNLPPLSDKDAMLNLHGKWLIELPELADIKRADFNQVKAYISRRIDTVRPHYGRLKSDVPRQSVFLGTVNEGQYFKDPTGNRRYWPVKVGRCDDAGLAEIRDQLFAEVMELYRAETEFLMLSPTAEKQAREAQEHRRVDDDESEMRDALLVFRELPVGRAFPWHQFKSRDLMVGPNAPWGPWAARNYVFQNASQVLHNLGFERWKSDGQRVWRTKLKNARAE
jgi:predicted P-loop ATPase